MEQKFPLLTADDIEVKVKKVSEKGAIALLYKTARVDMNMLDSVVGSMNWHDSYREIKGNLYCTISIWDVDKKDWVGKEDCGIESREDDEGNQRKGEASDAFKRAGFKWGIGRELYTAPFIFLNVPTKPKSGGRGYELSNAFARYSVSRIGYDESGRINKLEIVDESGSCLYKLGNKTKSPGNSDSPTNLEYIDEIKQTVLLKELSRTGWNAKEMLSYLEKKYPETPPDTIGHITEKQFTDLVKMLGKRPDKS